MLVLLFAMLCGRSGAITEPGLTGALLAETIGRFNAEAHTPLPGLSPAQRQELLDGEVVRLMVSQPNGTLRVVGIILTEQSRRSMWLSTQDHHFSGGDAIEAPIYLEPNRSSWYALLDLPRPFRDRHWVIEIWNNVELAQKNGGEFWEHPWQLNPDGVAAARPLVERGEVAGIDLDDFDAALYTPVNHGALVFIALPGGHSMMIYDVTSVIGGSIPDRLVAEFVRARMERSLRKVEQRAREIIPGHYRAGHDPVLGADGAPVPHFP